jgi:NadR type nicotinamide-nucleotide adenylyltransferase
MKDNPIRISIIGPECSGKTTLADQLASHFDAKLVSEYARTYLEQKGAPASYEDLYQIAIGQHELENQAEKAALAKAQGSVIISDTDLQVVRIWSEIAFEKCDNRILSMLAAARRDIYLLTYPDLVWVADGQREYPDEKDRLRIFHHYLDSMVGQQSFFEIIKGQGTLRLETAIIAINRVISARLPHQDPA